MAPWEGQIRALGVGRETILVMHARVLRYAQAHIHPMCRTRRRRRRQACQLVFTPHKSETCKMLYMKIFSVIQAALGAKTVHNVKIVNVVKLMLG
jgi:hypothetical protein